MGEGCWKVHKTKQQQKKHFVKVHGLMFIYVFKLPIKLGLLAEYIQHFCDYNKDKKTPK